MSSIRKTPSLSPEGRLRVLHRQRKLREDELGRIEREFDRTYPKLHYLEVQAWKAYMDKEREKLRKVVRAIERLEGTAPEPERQMTFGFEK
jgi:hypothetical protein